MLYPYFEMDSVGLQVSSIIVALQLGSKEGEFLGERQDSTSHKLVSLVGGPKVLACGQFGSFSLVVVVEGISRIHW